jgi:predicted nucleic acid-binding protein
VRFWDTSAVVPLCVREPASTAARRIVAADTAMAVWWATRTECVSALARRRREGGLTAAGEEHARESLEVLVGEWSEVLPSDSLRASAERLLAVHALRAADALQLAAALVWSLGQPREHVFVCFDERLRDAARHEGFRVVPR